MHKIIQTNEELVEFCSYLKEERFVTIDTEFIREKTYYPQLCLIQIAGTTKAAAIDPLVEDLDLSPLYELLQNEAIIKVFHACRQDIEIFYQRTGLIPTPIFDTQVAAMACGHGESISYENLVGKILNQSLDKSSRFTDWAKRPLSEKQLNYAMDDVLFLRDIYLYLEKQLQESGRAEWINDEMQPLLQASTYESDPKEVWRKVRVRSYAPKYLAAVQAVAYWREITAKERNIPRSRVMKDETIVEVSYVRPKDFSELQAIRGFHPAMSATNYDALFIILKNLEELPASEYPKMPARPTVTPNEALMDLLKILLKHCAIRNQIVPRIIAEKEELEAIALGKREDLTILTGWRYELFGKKAVQLLEGKISVKSDGENGVEFIELTYDDNWITTTP